MQKSAIIIYGPPGSGKGTQANLIEARLPMAIHFDTGKVLEGVVYDKAKQSDPVIRRERKNFETGKLMTPAWVFKVVKAKTEETARGGFTIVYSGSPRTLPEARGLLPVLIRHYGKKNIYPVVLTVSPATSVERNSKRMLCSVCGMTILNTILPPGTRLKSCVFCGASFRRRTLDNPEVIKVRLKEYHERTEPIFGYLSGQGVGGIKVDGVPAPYKAFSNILKKIGVRDSLAKSGGGQKDESR